LFHRLNVIRLRIPPLRERREDIETLMKHFLSVAADDLAIEPKIVHPDAAAYMCNAYHWPGNVRQLENVCRWLMVMAPAQEIHSDDLPPEIRSGEAAVEGGDNWEKQLRSWAEYHLARGEKEIFCKAIPTFERVLIETALNKTGGRRQDAAKLLGWGRNTLTRKIKDLGMDV
jgi:two-component system nitrogen regulation response regulator GlnG